ncbi:MAG: exodeoxyribonuclease VII large subunit [Pseudomonadota bacterium]
MSISDTGEILSVSAVNKEARSLLEQGLGSLAVIGEISNLARPQSGHLYFSLKDEQAQLRCAFFRQRQRKLSFHPQNGDEVIVFGKVGLYEPRGDYQLIVEHMEAAGAGALQQRFEALKLQLAAEGLFAAEDKRSLPKLPKRIGVVTSPSGAAVRDILNILKRRFPAVAVRIFPVAVQGAAAPAEIAAALRTASYRDDCDVILLARGGGSIEDLWAFNEEVVARAIYDCAVPVISGVGHETDTTIADFVADVRAPTPSGAAELAVPDQQEWLSEINALQTRLDNSWQQALTTRQQRLDWLSQGLKAHHPGAQLRMRKERISMAQLTLASQVKQLLHSYELKLAETRTRLHRHSPQARLVNDKQHLTDLTRELQAAIGELLVRSRQRLALASRGLNAISPLSTLSRGYAIVTGNGQVLSDTDNSSVGDDVSIRLSQGSLNARITEVHAKDDDS